MNSQDHKASTIHTASSRCLGAASRPSLSSPPPFSLPSPQHILGWNISVFGAAAGGGISAGIVGLSLQQALKVGLSELRDASDPGWGREWGWRQGREGGRRRGMEAGQQRRAASETVREAGHDRTLWAPALGRGIAH